MASPDSHLDFPFETVVTVEMRSGEDVRKHELRIKELQRECSSQAFLHLLYTSARTKLITQHASNLAPHLTDGGKNLHSDKHLVKSSTNGLHRSLRICFCT